MGNVVTKSRILTIALVALVVLLPACTHRRVVQVGSHTVTVLRHGFEKKFHVTQKPSVPGFEYAGLATDGRGLKVSIEGDRVTVNGIPGKLRPGDSVLIGDDGVAVNSLDYGESEKYLRANNSATEASASN